MILVSKSPRRQQILEMAGYQFEVVPSQVDEKHPKDLAIEKIPEFLAEKKASAIADNYPNQILLAADTIVIIDEEILEKPNDDIDAIEMLKKLSGRAHRVISGGCVMLNDDIITFSDESLVYFRELELDEILYYVENFKPFDKAGAYGIQEWIGMVGIEKIEGSFYNVMGLPIHKVYKSLLLITNQ